VLRVEAQGVEGFNQELEDFIAISATAVKKEDGEVVIQELSLNKTIPMPKELSEDNPERNLKKYGFKDWYDWRCSNWGTKWEVDCLSVPFYNYRSIIYIFHSAWCPPVEWLKAVAKKYPNLYFSLDFCEFRCNFCGLLNVQNDKIDFQVNNEWHDRSDIESIYGKKPQNRFMEDAVWKIKQEQEEKEMKKLLEKEKKWSKEASKKMK